MAEGLSREFRDMVSQGHNVRNIIRHLEKSHLPVKVAKVVRDYEADMDIIEEFQVRHGLKSRPLTR